MWVEIDVRAIIISNIWGYGGIWNGYKCYLLIWTNNRDDRTPNRVNLCCFIVMNRCIYSYILCIDSSNVLNGSHKSHIFAHRHIGIVQSQNIIVRHRSIFKTRDGCLIDCRRVTISTKFEWRASLWIDNFTTSWFQLTHDRSTISILY